MQARELGALLLLAALSGSSFLFIMSAVLALAPFVLMELRVGLAALALAPLCFPVSRLPALRTRWKEFLTLGLLNAAIPLPRSRGPYKPSSLTPCPPLGFTVIRRVRLLCLVC